MKATRKLLVSLGACLVFATPAWALPFGALHAFGDSLSDAGDNPSAVLSIHELIGGCDPLHPCPPYFGGRYSNGPVAAERLAEAILPGGAHPGNYFSFAVAGSTSGIGNFGDAGSAKAIGAHGLPGMAQQLLAYASTSGGAADPNALYFVWGGGNDFLTADSPVDAANDIAGYVATLAAMGARHILVPNLPDLSHTPFAREAGLQAPAHAFSVQFNETLATLLTGLDASLAADIIAFDTFALLDAVVANPADFGFADAVHACLASPATMCADPGAFVFWDGFHPTTAAHAVIADAFADALATAVPEPASLLLLAAGLAAGIATLGSRGLPKR
ncbi:MAG TPA: SGNH/GDSL hydrolase family protein [Zeimonas sp.]